MSLEEALNKTTEVIQEQNALLAQLVEGQKKAIAAMEGGAKSSSRSTSKPAPAKAEEPETSEDDTAQEDAKPAAKKSTSTGSAAKKSTSTGRGRGRPKKPKYEDIRAKAAELLEGADDEDEAKDLIRAIAQEHGAKKLAEIEEENWPKVLAQIQEAIDTGKVNFGADEDAEEDDDDPVG